MQDPKTGVLLSKDGSVHITDEVCNTLISASGAMLSLIGTAFLVSIAWRGSDPSKVLAFSVYGFCIVTLFISSALHHGVNGSPKTNHFLRQIDYFAIFVMIAGTATPFCLILLKDGLGRILLGLVWTLAAIGILIKAIHPHLPRWFTLSFYIGMGWLGVLIVNPIYQAFRWRGIIGFFLGGLFYTVGGLIYFLERPNPFPGKFGFHEIWHCSVLAGAASHFYVIGLLI